MLAAGAAGDQRGIAGSLDDIGKSLLMLGKYDEALTSLRLVRDEDPDNDHALYMLAVAHAQDEEGLEEGINVSRLARQLRVTPAFVTTEAGKLIAQRLLKDPLGQVLAHEYTITGNWAEPKVERVLNIDRQPAAPSQ